MTETFLTLVANWGPLAVALSAYLSCLLVPIPTALVMLAGGAFAAAGDLSLAAVLVSGWLAAILGDQTGYHIGRLAGPSIARLADDHPQHRASYDRARRLVAEKGSLAVFFSTWALAPLGPYVNFAAGAGGLDLLKFTLWDALGEAIWVGFYVLMGYAFSSELTQLASLLSNATGALVTLFVAGLLGTLLIRRAVYNHDG